MTSILFAAADSNDTVVLALSAKPADYSVFSVYENEKKLTGVSRKNPDNDTVIISLQDIIDDPVKIYTVRDETGIFTEQRVTMRRILDGYCYTGNDLGLTYSAEKCLFKVWAPTAEYVSIALYDNAGEYNTEGKVVSQETGNLHRMEKDPVTGVWSGIINGDLQGRFYLYRIEFADKTKTWSADPYAKAVSANGQRMAIVDPAKTNPPHWREKPKPPFTAGAWQDAVIYELHVRDFSIDDNSGMKHKGKYLAFTERGTTTKDGIPTGVDHLVNLGITHVHLLPTFDFASVNELAVDDPDSAYPKFNWGYDPMHYNVPEGSYATDPANPAARIIEFKRMVQALHDAGIRIILDMVFNHTYETSGWPFDSIVPGYYYRTADDGNYANGSGCGNEVASERPMVRKFIIDSCRYWAEEYCVDGFRFDLMGLIDTPTMEQLTMELRRDIDPAFIIYGEPWQAGDSVLPEHLQTITGAQKGRGFAVFNDQLRTAIKGGSDDNSRGFATGEPSMEAGIACGVTGSINYFTEQANESINYVTAHDNLNLWDKITCSQNVSDAKVTEGTKAVLPENVKSALLANGIIFTSQGIPFFQAGDEFLRSKFGDHNSYKSPDSINKIRWENAGIYRNVVDYYAGLIRLRKEHPAFRQTLRADIEKSLEILCAEDMGVSFTLSGGNCGDSWRTIFTAYNGSLEPKKFTLPALPDNRKWQQVVDAQCAGTKTLAEFSDLITLPPISMTVLFDRSP
ncbi:MAG: type I pullulanase [Treponema sp.]|nr:type I pullulanase [Treponema sp.]